MKQESEWKPKLVGFLCKWCRRTKIREVVTKVTRELNEINPTSLFAGERYESNKGCEQYLVLTVTS